MAKFMTENEIEKLLVEEIRYLPIPEPLSIQAKESVTVYKKKPVKMFKTVWETYDFLIDAEYKFYTRNELLGDAAKASLENGIDFDTNFHNVVVSAHKKLALELLPILNKDNS